tara:strand:- start:1801 stop:2031 length:231 start_codon:yes stop_codon:yes gene_type:complete
MNTDDYIPDAEHPLERMEMEHIARVLYTQSLEDFFKIKYEHQPLPLVVEELLSDLLNAFAGVDIIGLLTKKQEEWK